MKIGLMLTSKCSKQCWFCYMDSKQEKYSELDIDELRSFVLELDKLKQKPTLCFGGGEPTEYSKIEELTNFLEDLKYPYSITSNLLKYEKLSNIKHGWIWGSLHFPEELDYIIKTMSYLNTKNKGVNILVMKSYVDKIENIIDTLRREDLDYMITFYKTYGRAKNVEKEELVYEEKQELVKKLAKKYGGIYTDSCPNLVNKKICNCGVGWVTITEQKVLKPNSFYQTGVKIQSLTLKNFIDAYKQIPKQVHNI
ncbi:MAG: radical SAM protein [Endomicrobiia bacterium]